MTKHIKLQNKWETFWRNFGDDEILGQLSAFHENAIQFNFL